MKAIVLGLVILASPVASSEQHPTDNSDSWGESTVSGCVGDTRVCESDFITRSIDMHNYVSGSIGLVA